MKKSFTMLELIFVIIVIGILAAVLSPEMKSNKIREAAIQLISHIRYTQHLAMIDDKFDTTNPIWYKSRWQLIFRTTIKETSSGGETINVQSYTIFSDKQSNTGTLPDGNPNTTNNEIALDPANSNKFLSGGFSTTISLEHKRRKHNMELKSTYGIIDVDFLDGCSGAKRITFDHLGRPLFGLTSSTNSPYEKLMTQSCKISICSVSNCSTVSEGDSKVTIVIEPETGYAHIL